MEKVFWDIWNEKHESSGGIRCRFPTDESKCYIFELLSDEIETEHLPTLTHWANEEGCNGEIYLTGIRDLTGEPYPLLPYAEVREIAGQHGWRVFERIHTFHTTQELLEESQRVMLRYLDRGIPGQRGLVRGFVLRFDCGSWKGEYPSALEYKIFVVKAPQFVAALNLKVRPDESIKEIAGDYWGWHKVRSLYE